MFRRWLAACAALSMFFPIATFGAQCSAGNTAERLKFVREGLAETASSAHRWALGWGLGWAVVSAAQIGVALGPRNPDDRIDLLVQAGAAAVGTIPTLIIPPRVIGATESLSAEPSCESLAAAEAVLRAGVREEHLESGWPAYAGNVGFNAAITLALGLGLHHWPTAVISSVLGIPLGSLMIYTRPRGATRLLEQYENQKFAAAATGPELSLGPLVTARGSYGLQLSVSF